MAVSKRKLDATDKLDAKVYAMIQDMSCAALLDLLAESGASDSLVCALRTEAGAQYELGLLRAERIAEFWEDDESPQ